MRDIELIYLDKVSPQLIWDNQAGIQTDGTGCHVHNSQSVRSSAGTVHGWCVYTAIRCGCYQSSVCTPDPRT